jgi:hypothetical protein
MSPAAAVLFELPAGRVVELSLILAQGFGIDAAFPANSAVAFKDLRAQIAGEILVAALTHEIGQVLPDSAHSQSGILQAHLGVHEATMAERGRTAVYE